jgi:hypothetical protein
MQPPQTRKEVQKLTGRIVALNRFIVKLAEKVYPFQHIAWLRKSRLGSRVAASF